ncbi:MAG TPA: NnrS family protein [Candidatus Obscuribacterales bacterium]
MEKVAAKVKKTMPVDRESCKKEDDKVPMFFVREHRLIHLLMAYLCTGLLFMIVPGTLLGVVNLFTIGGQHAPASVSPAWVQAHGHAQLMGWLGSFILGIGFYSIPNLRKVVAFSFWEGWASLLLWSSGVWMRWVALIYEWHWRLLLPLSALFELCAVAIFLALTISGHRRQSSPHRRVSPWAVLVIAGTAGLALYSLLNFLIAWHLSILGNSPVFPKEVNSRMIVLAAWGFVVPVAFGFTVKWLPVLLGLKADSERGLLCALVLNVCGITAFFAGLQLLAAILLLLASCLFVWSARLFHKRISAAKTSGVSPAFPHFVVAAYLWLLIANILSCIAAVSGGDGFSGAARHAITVGFMSTMVFAVGPRLLPAFLGRKGIFSSGLMTAALSILSLGCALRVVSQSLAYQGLAPWAWALLPVSATLELIAFLSFAGNMLLTFRTPHLMPLKR